MTIELSKPGGQLRGTLFVRLRQLSESLVLHAVLCDRLDRERDVLILLELPAWLLNRFIRRVAVFIEGTDFARALSAPKVSRVHCCVGAWWVKGHLNFLTYASYVDYALLGTL